MITYVYRSACKVPVSLLRFPSNLTFLDRLSKNDQIPNVMKIRPLRGGVFHADGQTD